MLQPSTILQNPAEALQAAKRAYPQPQNTLDIKKVKLVEHPNLQNLQPSTCNINDGVATITAAPPATGQPLTTVITPRVNAAAATTAVTAADTITSADTISSRVSEVNQLMSYELHPSQTVSIKNMTGVVQPVAPSSAQT